MTTSNSTRTVLLIAGHWLGAWAWDEVLDHLQTDYPRTLAVTLPGLDANDPVRAAATLDDQAAAIVDTLTRTGGDPAVIVAHSGANFPVCLVLDRHPELVHRVVWVDSGPVAPGSIFAPDLPDSVQELPLPPFDILSQQASLEGLSLEDLERFRAQSVPEPGGVLRQPANLEHGTGTDVPTTLVCCSIPGAQMLELARGGHPMFAEVAKLDQPDVVDLPTGHWPMWSRPRDLARVIGAAASFTSAASESV